MIITTLVVFFSFGLVGAVFAETNVTSLEGRDGVSFDAQLSPSELSAQNAAMNYEYDQGTLVRGGTEADWEYRLDTSPSAPRSAVADKDKMNKPVCSNC